MAVEPPERASIDITDALDAIRETLRSVAESVHDTARHMERMTEAIHAAHKALASLRKLIDEANVDGMWPSDARVCGACGQRAQVMMDGAPTCLNCGNRPERRGH